MIPALRPRIANPFGGAVILNDDTARSATPLKAILILWLVGNALLFFLVSLPPDGPIAALMPDFILSARGWALPFFTGTPSNQLFQ